MSREDDDTKRSKKVCTCTTINTAYSGNPHGHSVGCDCWGLDIPNRMENEIHKGKVQDGTPEGLEFAISFDEEVTKDAYGEVSSRRWLASVPTMLGVVAYGATKDEAARELVERVQAFVHDRLANAPTDAPEMSEAEQQAEADEITSTIQAILAKGDDAVDPMARRLHAAAIAGDREAIRHLREEIKAADNDMARGIQFSVRRDADPRWDLVTIRLPNASFHNRDHLPKPEFSLHGDHARWRFVKWVIATVRSVASMLGAPPEFEMALLLLHKEAQVQSASVDSDA